MKSLLNKMVLLACVSIAFAAPIMAETSGMHAWSSTKVAAQSAGRFLDRHKFVLAFASGMALAYLKDSVEASMHVSLKLLLQKHITSALNKIKLLFTREPKKQAPVISSTASETPAETGLSSAQIAAVIEEAASQAEQGGMTPAEIAALKNEIARNWASFQL